MKVFLAFIVVFVSVFTLCTPVVQSQNNDVQLLRENSVKQSDPESPQSLQTDIFGPVGSGQFGQFVNVLSNGNIVVSDPFYDAPGPIVDVGAVYLYDGSTGALISRLVGNTAGDFVGSGGITVLPNGHFVARSPGWDSPTAVNVGAGTWCSSVAGCPPTIAAANSLVGTTAGDNVGNEGITVLPNGNYVVRSSLWDNGGATNAGAVTWCGGTGATVGAISPTNSIVGTRSGDIIGDGGITVLTNGNYVVSSVSWDNGATENVGAVTWGNGAIGIAGEISSSNSLIGPQASDQVGNGGVTALTNGNYVVKSRNWSNAGVASAGAVTLGNGTTGTSGVVSSANSLIGTRNSDLVGDGGVKALPNGNYVVSSLSWDNSSAVNAGAVTWGNGTTGIVGEISSSNSLIGSRASDQIGSGTITILPNNNYVILSPLFDAPAAANIGAATLGNGAGGTVGEITSGNSLIGAHNNDSVGDGGVTILMNGNYVVRSVSWDNGSVDNAGAVTWCSSGSGTVGTLSSSNSFVGSRDSDQIGSQGVTALTNGNYVIASPFWDHPIVSNVGAVTWGNGASGIVGEVSFSNSLYGARNNDRIGDGGVTALTNGNFVVANPSFDGPLNANIGAATWGNGASGTFGEISLANSLVGTQTSDQIASGGITSLSNGNYVVRSTSWNNASNSQAGAVTWGNGAAGTTGVVGAGNSLVGSSVSDHIGDGGVAALNNGNYVVGSPSWDGGVQNVGAFTWVNGAAGMSGVINSANSFVGSQSGDSVASGGITVLANGNYVVHSPLWDGGNINSGVLTYGPGNVAFNGQTGANTVGGSAPSGGFSMVPYLDIFNETVIVARPAENTISILNPTFRSVSNGNWTSTATWDYGAFSRPHDVVIPNGRTVNINVVSTVSSLTINCAGAVTGASATGYIIGNIHKDYCATGAFSYPTGTANGYSPVDADVTVLSANPSSLTVRSTQTVHPSLSAGNSLKRFWTLTKTGDLLTDLTFHYLDPTDISSGESTYKLYRVVSGNPIPIAPFTLNTGANSISTTNVSDFSDWAVGNVVPIVSVSGRVTNSVGRGIKSAAVSITDSLNVTSTVRTDAFGRYTFQNVGTGEVYTILVANRRYTFVPQQIFVNGNLTNIDFVGTSARPGDDARGEWIDQ